eukprot:NODE_186_length_13589_cov_0.385545.p9 type:complete len:227 gc:universal NODE_186_length_13589_cov_0.385545:6394-7074(+)
MLFTTILASDLLFICSMRSFQSNQYLPGNPTYDSLVNPTHYGDRTISYPNESTIKMESNSDSSSESIQLVHGKGTIVHENDQSMVSCHIQRGYSKKDIKTGPREIPQNLQLYGENIHQYFDPNGNVEPLFMGRISLNMFAFIGASFDHVELVENAVYIVTDIYEYYVIHESKWKRFKYQIGDYVFSGRNIEHEDVKFERIEPIHLNVNQKFASVGEFATYLNHVFQ